MFTVDEATATAIQSAYRAKGEWAAIVELRRYFAINDNAVARHVVRMIAGRGEAHPGPATR